jgi:hypothetical protein
MNLYQGKGRPTTVTVKKSTTTVNRPALVLVLEWKTLMLVITLLSIELFVRGL